MSDSRSSNPKSPIRIGILTVSDRAYRGEYKDRGGPAVQEYLNRVLTCDWVPLARVVPDERDAIIEAITTMCDHEGAGLVVTTGGTGPAPRDITPEITEELCGKMLPGFGELMRKISLEVVPTAILSRQTAGIRGRSLIVNLPGKPSAIAECLDAIMPAVPYCIDLIGGPYLTTDENLVKAFRPKNR